MSPTLKNMTQDETRIGEHAAAQPLSGTRIVSAARVHGFGNMAVTRAEETEKKSN
ncbi:MAG: hypothetical protein KGI97_01790 [Alphaproteobacteria bacterium]|nr:hypothetical protein [Alphaproteobacteria bacterium]